MKYVLALLALLFCSAAQAQEALVVTTCGTLPRPYDAGATRLITVDTTGKMCGTGGGGAGNPGGSNTQVQYNNGGSFGGITGATTNGTALTLVAPVLGTPASGTLTNTTGFPVANLAGAGTGVLTALGINIGSAGAPVLFNGAGGTPSSMVGTNITGTAAGLTAGTASAVAVGGITGLGTGVATWLATPSSTNLAAAVTGETGTGALVFGTSPTFTTGVTLGFITGSTQCLTVDTSGVVSGTGAVCGGSGASGANPSATAGPTAVNGVATTFLRSDGAPAVQQGSASIKGIVQVDGTTITAASGVISGVTPPITPNPQTGANYAIVTGDLGKLVNLSNGSNQIPTIAQAGSAGFLTGWFTTVCNQGAGTQTITPATSTIGGAATFVLPAGSALRPPCVAIVSDGTNYQVAPNFPMDASQFSAGTLAVARGGTGITSFGTGVATAMGSNVNTNGGLLTAATAAIASNAIVTGAGSGTAVTGTTPGTGVLTALGVNASAAGGMSLVVASGTSALGTSAIGSAACATAVTTTATNTVTTDVILWGFNGDPTAVTGYVPLTTGMLTIIAYPSANNVNYKVCNNTSSSITPGAITLNWRVVR